MAAETETLLTQDQITDLVSRYLAGQGWELAVPEEMAEAIWKSLDGKTTQSAVLREIPRRYATLLHIHCQEKESAEHGMAWQEVKSYLEKTVGRLENHSPTQQEIIQETLIGLQQSLPLQKPQAFLVFAFTTLRSKAIDLNRRQTAEKRDRRKTIPFEELGTKDDSEESDRHWEEYLRASKGIWRTIESTVSNQETRQQLLQFAQKHLPTDLQQMVFEAHFLNGLKPADIAPLLGKQPHEIRLVKARIVKKLKSLPPPEAEQLLEILRRIDSDA